MSKAEEPLLLNDDHRHDLSVMSLPEWCFQFSLVLCLQCLYLSGKIKLNQNNYQAGKNLNQPALCCVFKRELENYHGGLQKDKCYMKMSWQFLMTQKSLFARWRTLCFAAVYAFSVCSVAWSPLFIFPSPLWLSYSERTGAVQCMDRTL